MSRSISANKIAELKPIIDRLDVEMSKPQQSRTDFSIEARNNPEAIRKIKTNLVDWKTLHRPEWRGKLLLRVKHDKLTFMFNNMQSAQWNFVDTAPREGFEFVEEDTIFGKDGLIRELSDGDLAQLLIMESPASVVVDPSMLSNATLAWLEDSSVEITALGRVLSKHGYQWTVYANKVKIFLPGSAE